jgi:hypothetical protein
MLFCCHSQRSGCFQQLFITSNDDQNRHAIKEDFTVRAAGQFPHNILSAICQKSCENLMRYATFAFYSEHSWVFWQDAARIWRAGGSVKLHGIGQPVP